MVTVTVFGTHPVAEFLLHVQTLADLHAPEISLEDDGDLGFDWANNITVSLSAVGHVCWSALFGSVKACGRFQIDQPWPTDFIDALKALEDQ